MVERFCQLLFVCFAGPTPAKRHGASYLESLRAAFIARGADAATAAQRAYAAAAGMVARQAATLSFIDLFWILAMFFLAMIPLLFFMKRREQVEVAMAGE